MENKSKKNEISISIKNVLIGLGILVVLAIATFFYFSSPETTTEITGDVFATVNGEPILSSQVEQIQQDYAMQGMQLTLEDAAEQVIDQEILFQEAEREGHSASIQEAEEIIEFQVMQQGQSIEDVKQQLKMQGLSYESILEDYRRQITLNSYVEDLLERNLPEISEEELQAFYEENKAMLGDEIPSFEEVKDQLKMLLQQEQQQQIINAVIQELRDNADIEYKQDFEELDISQEDIDQVQEIEIVTEEFVD